MDFCECTATPPIQEPSALEPGSSEVPGLDLMTLARELLLGQIANAGDTLLKQGRGTRRRNPRHAKGPQPNGSDV